MRILVVEDEAGISSFLQKGLIEEGFDVNLAESGNQAKTLLDNELFDLVLLDWMLPEISGLELCAYIRKEDQKTPIIFLTSKDTVDDTVQALEAGANDYIKKPFHFDELLARIHVHFRKGQKQVLKLGPIEVHLNTVEVFKNGEKINLTQKEFQLLEYLITNKGTVCTRTDIIKDVWDVHFEYNTGVIDVYINALRKKIALFDDDNLIQTVRGIGYIAREE